MTESRPQSPESRQASPVVHPWVAEGNRRIRFGVGPQRPDWPALRDRVRHLEALGFDSFWVEDHPRGNCARWATRAAQARGRRQTPPSVAA